MTLADRLLLVLVVTGLGLLFYITWQPSTRATRVEIMTPAGTKIVSLLNDKKLTLSGAIGASEIQIEKHRVRFVSSPCKTKFCIHQGWAEHSGEMRVCLPNKVSLRLLGQATVFDSETF
jgi:hypothetical protein